MKLDSKGRTWQCNACGKQEDGVFRGCVDNFYPPREWFAGERDKTYCTKECLLKITGQEADAE